MLGRVAVVADGEDLEWHLLNIPPYLALFQYPVEIISIIRRLNAEMVQRSEFVGILARTGVINAELFETI